MEAKELKIIPPEGYEIDKENSTFECIKFKPVKRWRDNEDELFKGYFINHDSIIQYAPSCYNNDFNNNIFATEKQAKSALAMAQISQIMANDKRFGGAVTDEEWCNILMNKFVIYRTYNKIKNNYFYGTEYYFLAFHTAEQRDLFLEENEDLVKDYLMID